MIRRPGGRENRTREGPRREKRERGEDSRAQMVKENLNFEER